MHTHTHTYALLRPCKSRADPPLWTHVFTGDSDTHSHGRREQPAQSLSEPCSDTQTALSTLTPIVLSTPGMCTQTSGGLCTHPGRDPGEGEPGPRGRWGNCSGSLHLPLLESLSLDFPIYKSSCGVRSLALGSQSREGTGTREWGSLRPRRRREPHSAQGILRQRFLTVFHRWGN